MKIIDRLFPKRYRVVSDVTGPGIGYPYRFLLHAAYDAVRFESIELLTGLPRQGWHVQSIEGQEKFKNGL